VLCFSWDAVLETWASVRNIMASSSAQSGVTWDYFCPWTTHKCCRLWVCRPCYIEQEKPFSNGCLCNLFLLWRIYIRTHLRMFSRFKILFWSWNHTLRSQKLHISHTWCQDWTVFSRYINWKYLILSPEWYEKNRKKPIDFPLPIHKSEGCTNVQVCISVIQRTCWGTSTWWHLRPTIR
jgi:hypothetical protein